MKKKLVLILAIILTTVLFNGCASTGEQIIPSDPNNPFQGTWVSMGSANINNQTQYMHMIQGFNGTLYSRHMTVVYTMSKWEKAAVYTIEQTEEGNYTTSNNWRIRVDGNILTVENMTYERVIQW